MAIKEPFEQSRTASPTGANLAIYSMAASGKPRGIVQINHGMAEHAARYARFAGTLTRAGYHVIAHDHRGHGQTSAQDAPKGVFGHSGGLDLAIADMAHVNAHARQTFGNLPVILFGHSMGTILGMTYLQRHAETINAAALWNSGVDTGFLGFVFGSLLKIERMFKGSDVPSSLAQILTFEAWNKQFAPNRTDFDWLSRDEHEVDKYVEDPMCGFPVSIGLWLDVLEAIYEGADNTRLAAIPKDLPIHLLAGGEDPCSLKGKAVERIHTRMKKTGMKNVSLTILPGTRHESLNEINRDETTNAFVDWLNREFV